MLYLYGDSTESNLSFDYLAFLRDVMDCAVVMIDCELKLATTVDTRRTREADAATSIAAVEELGKRATQLVAPVAETQAGTPAGRCATAIAAAIQAAVDREAAQARTALQGERSELDKEDERQRGRAKGALEKLLRAHDLPDAEKELGVAWTGASGVRATMRQKTPHGIEAVVALDIPPSSVLGVDLRVDRLAEGVEVHAFEAGGWLKKGDKLVAHKLGRYQVASVTIGATDVVVRLRSSPDPGSSGFVLVSRKNAELTIQPAGEGPIREVAVDDRARPALRQLVDKLEAAVRAIGDNRTGLATLEIDGKPLAQHGHPRVLVERLITAIAPTVQNIARHSRSPGELVLRRMVADNRREELFVSTADLLKKLDPLPPQARGVFAPLHLGGAIAGGVDTEWSQPLSAPTAIPPATTAPVPTQMLVTASAPTPMVIPASVTGPASAPVPVPVPAPASAPAWSTAPIPTPAGKSESEPVVSEPPRRTPSRTAPPVPMPDPRSGPFRTAPQISEPPKRMARPPVATAADSPFEDREAPAIPSPRGSGSQSTRLPAMLVEKPEANAEALGKAIEAALDEEESVRPTGNGTDSSSGS